MELIDRHDRLGSLWLAGLLWQPFALRAPIATAVHAIATEDIEEPEFCPLCFGPAEKCPIYLRPVSRQPLVLCRTYAPTATVETHWFGVSFQAGSLKKSTTNAPSKNHPVVCPVRACQQITWSYNMDAHWTRLHETMDMPPWFREEIQLADEEENRLRELGEKQIK